MSMPEYIDWSYLQLQRSTLAPWWWIALVSLEVKKAVVLAAAMMAAIRAQGQAILNEARAGVERAVRTVKEMSISGERMKESERGGVSASP